MRGKSLSFKYLGCKISVRYLASEGRRGECPGGE